jgi:hypothetical protein
MGVKFAGRASLGPFSTMGRPSIHFETDAKYWNELVVSPSDYTLVWK